MYLYFTKRNCLRQTERKDFEMGGLNKVKRLKSQNRKVGDARIPTEGKVEKSKTWDNAGATAAVL